MSANGAAAAVPARSYASFPSDAPRVRRALCKCSNAPHEAHALATAVPLGVAAVGAFVAAFGAGSPLCEDSAAAVGFSPAPPSAWGAAFDRIVDVDAPPSRTLGLSMALSGSRVASLIERQTVERFHDEQYIELVSASTITAVPEVEVFTVWLVFRFVPLGPAMASLSVVGWLERAISSVVSARAFELKRAQVEAMIARLVGRYGSAASSFAVGVGAAGVALPLAMASRAVTAGRAVHVETEAAPRDEQEVSDGGAHVRATPVAPPAHAPERQVANAWRPTRVATLASRAAALTVALLSAVLVAAAVWRTVTLGPLGERAQRLAVQSQGLATFGLDAGCAGSGRRAALEWLGPAVVPQPTLPDSLGLGVLVTSAAEIQAQLGALQRRLVETHEAIADTRGLNGLVDAVAQRRGGVRANRAD